MEAPGRGDIYGWHVYIISLFRDVLGNPPSQHQSHLRALIVLLATSGDLEKSDDNCSSYIIGSAINGPGVDDSGDRLHEKARKQSINQRPSIEVLQARPGLT